MDSPPKPEEVKAWIADHEAKKEVLGEETPEVDSTQKDQEAPDHLGGPEQEEPEQQREPLDSDVPTPRPFGTSASIPIVLKNRKEALKYPVFYINMLTGLFVGMNGYATKVLLSSMFELIFNLPLMTSAYLSALSLLLFVIARGVFPFYFLDSKFSATSISIVAATLWCISFAVLPTIVGPGSTDGGFSWRLVGFVIIKSFVGACFACLSSVKSAVSSDVCGVANLRVVSSASWDAAGTGGTAGPIVAFTVTMARYYGGMDFAPAFALFFYIAAGIAFVSIILYVLLHRAVQKN